MITEDPSEHNYNSFKREHDVYRIIAEKQSDPDVKKYFLKPESFERCGDKIKHLVANYLVGFQTLEQYFSSTNLELKKHIITELCNAIHAMHTKLKVAHLDLKPDNIMIKEENSSTARVTLIDYGMSKPLTTTKNPAYYTRRDIYSLAACIASLLSNTSFFKYVWDSPDNNPYINLSDLQHKGISQEMAQYLKDALTNSTENIKEMGQHITTTLWETGTGGKPRKVHILRPKRHRTVTRNQPRHARRTKNKRQQSRLFESKKNRASSQSNRQSPIRVRSV